MAESLGYRPEEDFVGPKAKKWNFKNQNSGVQTTWFVGVRKNKDFFTILWQKTLLSGMGFVPWNMVGMDTPGMFDHSNIVMGLAHSFGPNNTYAMHIASWFNDKMA
ncbi:MAG: hypothetical protein AAGA86_10055 [Bacteroidota bacterium]